ncbi:MCE family protein [Amycolatopsis sp. NPDC059021]|uniref:MCE family protein n=1 Tax=Amycolatopsis sp. NPDC059021 TaxID=3346704 RepID=UPI003670205E
MRRPFRERDPLKLALAGTLVLALLAALAIGLPQVVFYTRTTDYTAELANAAGLRPDDQVFVAGVPAGRVRTIALAGDRVRVSFRLDGGQPLGDATTAGVKIQTILGKRYLDVHPGGGGRLASGGTIPLARTSVPYSLDDLGRSAASTTQQLDLAGLRRMITTLQDNAPDAKLAAQALQGVGTATAVFDKYREQLQALLKGAQQVTGNLVSQQDSLVKLLGDTDLVTSALAQRKNTLNTLIAEVADIAARIRSIVDTNRPLIGPMLQRLDTVVSGLTAHRGELDRVVAMLAPTGRYLANASGNGPWLDVTGPAGPLPDNLLCLAGLVKGCR